MSNLHRPVASAASLALAAIVFLGGIRPVAAEEAKGALSANDIGVMLENMGYQPTVDEDQKESPTRTFYFDVVAADLQFHVYAALSQDGTKFWLNANLVKVDAAQLCKDALLSLLDPCGLGEARFEYLPKDRQLRLVVSVDNRAITPAVLRKKIEELTGVALDTRALWEGNALTVEKP